MRVVLAGFGPFPGAPFNPSATIAKALARTRRPALTGCLRTAHVFATSYADVDRDLPKLFAAAPDIVLVFGLAARRRHVCIEMRARNAVSVLTPDAEGRRPARGPIEAGGPAALFGHAPFGRLQKALRERGIPARVSRDAGRYLCNYVYWRTLRQAPRGRPLVQFVHIPAIRQVAAPRSRVVRPSLSMAELVRAAENLLVAMVAATRR